MHLQCHHHINATATATKVKGDVWVTWKPLAAMGEDGWWRRISLSSSDDFFNGRFVFALFLKSVHCWRGSHATA
jgi:hypothetical protein